MTKLDNEHRIQRSHDGPYDADDIPHTASRFYGGLAVCGLILWMGYTVGYWLTKVALVEPDASTFIFMWVIGTILIVVVLITIAEWLNNQKRSN